MKLLNTGKDLEYYFNIRDLATAVERSPNTIWQWVKKQHLFAPPTIRLGNRDYYDKDTFETIVKKIQEMEALAS